MTARRSRLRLRTPEALDARLRDIVNETWGSDPHRTRPSHLYHYTKWEGLEGILSSQRFRARGHSHTNDDHELRTLHPMIATLLREAHSNARLPSERSILKKMIDGYEAYKISSYTTVYLACFTEKPDSPSQWLRYADGGRGVCLGITILLDENARWRNRGFEKVSYDLPSWRQNLADRLRRFVEHYRDAVTRHPGQREACDQAFLMRCYQLFAGAEILAKRPEPWADEAEWRVFEIWRKASPNPPKTKYLGDGAPYLELELRKNGLPIVLADVRLGPNQQDSDAAVERAARILGACGYGAEVAIVHSAVAV